MLAEGRGSEADGTPRTSWWQPWLALALFAFGLHFVWEILHSPLYVGLAGGTHLEGIKCCLLATVGDVILTLAAYGAVAAATRDRLWLATLSASRVGWFVAVGLVATILIEQLSVYAWGRWEYAPAMPTVLGIGLSPILQWIVLPLLTLWLARRHLGWFPVRVPRHRSPSTEATP